MTCYIITVDTDSADVQTEIEKRLNDYGNWHRIHSSCWAVVTALSPSYMRDDLLGDGNLLEGLPDRPERIFVIRSGTEAAWISYGSKTNEWLKENL